MSFECLQEVSNDYEKLLENERGYDVIIYVDESENVKEIHAHSLILSSRSQYFCVELSNENVEKIDGKFILKKPDIAPQLFKIILRFIYCGKMDLTKLEGHELLKLSMAVNELNIHSLIPRIEEYLINHQSEFLHQNLVEILETIYQHESFRNLWNFGLKKICEKPEILFNSDKFINLNASLLELLLKSNDLLEKICEKPEMLINSDNFINLNASMLELFLKRDDLILEEIDIWNILLKWGLAQNPSISQDFSKWNKEEITIIERTLHRFIPLVRFYYISPGDFIDKIYPLKELMPTDLVDNLLKFHIVRKPNIDVHPPRQPRHHKVDSAIIQPKHFAILASWIDKKENLHYDVENIPYSFNLLYRASRDGNTNVAFHEKCDNKGATIVIVKVTNSEQILGGYNPFFYDSSNNYISTNDSFIFSFKNKDNLQTAKVSYSINVNSQFSVSCYSTFGPAFGYLHTYPTIDGVPTSFGSDDFEVFQVIKK